MSLPPRPIFDLRRMSENTDSITGNVLTNDRDPEGEQLSLRSINGAAISGPTNIVGVYGTLVIAANGSYEYILNTSSPIVDGLTPGSVLQDQFVQVVADSAGNTAQSVLVVSIEGRNDAPRLTNDSFVLGLSPQLAQGLIYANVLANDFDPESGPLVVVDSRAGGVVAAAGNLLAGRYGQFTVFANGDVLYQADPNQSAFRQLAAGVEATDTVTVSVADAFGAVSRSTLTARIVGSNDTPEAVDDAASMTEDQAEVRGNLLRNDRDIDRGDTLEVWQVGTVRLFGNTGVATSPYGDLFVEPDGRYRFILNQAAVQELGEGETVTVPFTYIVTDDSSIPARATATLTITITGRNDRPIVTDDVGAFTVVDAPAPLVGNVLTNDADPDGDALSVTRVQGDSANVGAVLQGRYGTLRINADGSYSYQLNPLDADATRLAAGQTATERFSYRAEDPLGAGDRGVLTITIVGRNDAPIATGEARTLTEDAATATVTGNLLANDRDPDAGAVLTIAGVNGSAALPTGAIATAYGFVQVGADGSYSYTLDNASAAVQGLGRGETATDVITYVVSDGAGGAATAALTITVRGANDAPTADVVGVNVREDVTLSASGSVFSVIQDADGDAITVTQVAGRANRVGADVAGQYGVLRVNADGSYVYTLNNAAPAVQALATGQNLQDSFSLRVRDAEGASTTTSLVVTINGTDEANQPPQLARPLADQTSAEGSAFSFTVPAGSFVDPDSPSLTYSATRSDGSALPDWLSFDAATLTFTGAPPQGSAGTLSIRVTASDGGASIGDVFDVVVAGVASPATIILPPRIDGLEDTALPLTGIVITPAAGESVTQVVLSGFPAGTVLSAGTTTNSGQSWSFAGPLPAGLTVLGPQDLNGSFALTVRVTTSQDGTTATATASTTYIIGAVNDAPFVDVPIPDTTAREGTSFVFEIPDDAFADPDGDFLLKEARLANGDPLPSWLSYDGALTFSGTPPAGSAGTLNITVTATDAQFSAADTFALTIAPAAPVALPPSIGFGAGTSGPIPLDPADIRVNTTVLREQDTSTIAALADGGFIVVWSDETRGYQIAFQRFAADGSRVGSETLLSTGRAGVEWNSSVTALADGGFVIAYDSRNTQIIDSGEIYLKRFDAQGAQVGGEILVNTFTNNRQLAPDVMGLADGGFVVVWESSGQDGSGLGIYAQRYGANGNPLGGEVRVNTTTLNRQEYASLAALADGGYIVTWTSNLQDGSGTGVYAQRFNAAGAAVGAETLINTTTLGNQDVSRVVALLDGSYVIVWTGDSIVPASGDRDAFFQRFSPTGERLGVETRVNTTLPDFQFPSSVVALADGGFVITWDSNNQDGSEFGVYAQRFSATGAPIGAETRLNATTEGDQRNFSNGRTVAVLADGTFVANWYGYSQIFTGAPEESDTFVRRFQIDRAFVGPEDSAIPFAITVSTADPGDTLTQVVLSGLPAGSVLSAGAASAGGTVWTFTGAPPADLRFTPPANYNGSFVLTVTATSQDGGASATASATQTVTVTPMNDAPALVSPLQDSEATEGQSFVYPVSASAFFDVDGPSLSYSASLANGAPLPNWLGFDPVTRTFSGAPPQGSAGTVSIRVTASDGGASISDVFDVVVAGVASPAAITLPPRIDGLEDTALPLTGIIITPAAGESISQVVLSGFPTGTVLSAGTTTDSGQSWSFAGPLPAGLTVRGPQDLNRSFALTVRVTTSQDGTTATATASTTYIIGSVNDAPFVDVPIPDTTAREGTSFVFEIPDDTFADPDGDFLLKEARLANGDPLPSWLSYDGALTFSGTPPAGSAGTLNITVSAIDEQFGAEDTFALTIAPATPSGVQPAAISFSRPARGLAPLDATDIRVNLGQLADQEFSSVAALSGGGYVVAFSSAVFVPGAPGFFSASLGDIFLRRIDVNGNPIGGDVRVNTTTADFQFAPGVAALNTGGYVVSWTSRNQDGSADGVYAQRFNASGAPQGGEFRVNTATFREQEFAGMTALKDGGFVIIFSSQTNDPVNSRDLFAQRYDSSGSPVSGEVLVNTFRENDQAFGSVAALVDGGYVVTWTSNQQNAIGASVQGQRFDAANNRVGGEFQVSLIGPSLSQAPSVAGLNDGGFIVAFQVFGQTGPAGGYDVFAQRYNAAGAAVGSPFLVNTTTSLSQFAPQALATANGGFVISWNGQAQDVFPGATDAFSSGIYAQVFDAAGNRIGGETRLNAALAGGQNQRPDFGAASLSQAPDGTLAATFWGEGDVFLRRFAFEDFRGVAGSGQINLPISVTPADQGDTVTQVVLEGFPVGSVLQGASSSSGDGTVWVFNGPPPSTLSFTPPAGYAGNFTLTVTARTQDGAATATATSTVQVIVGAAGNTRPVIVSNGGTDVTAPPIIFENETIVTTIEVLDPDGATRTFSLSGPDAALFTIDQTTGVLSFINTQDAPFDSQLQFNVTVTVTDPAGATDVQSLLVTVRDLVPVGAPAIGFGQSGAIRLVTQSTGGGAANGSSFGAVFAPDGSKVAFLSRASDLVSGDTNGRTDVFIQDLAAGFITQVTGAGGVQGNDNSDRIAFDPSGQRLVFTSFASNLVSGDTNGRADLFVYDLNTGAVSRLALSNLGLQPNGNSSDPVFSPDGTRLAFTSFASNLVAGDTNNAADVFVLEIASGIVTRVSVPQAGGQANLNSFAPAFSADGQRLILTSNASNLVPGDTNGLPDIFVVVLSTGEVTRVNVNLNGDQATGQSDGGSFAPVGPLIGFRSTAPNLVANDTNGQFDSFVVDLSTGEVTRVSTNSAGQEVSDGDAPVFSPDGRYLVFASLADNISSGGPTGTFDLYLRDLVTGEVRRISQNADGVAGNGNSFEASFSPDGSRVVFRSASSNFVAGDANGLEDIFMVDVRQPFTGASGGAPIALPITVDATDPGDFISSVELSGLPPGSILSDGSSNFDGSIWTFFGPPPANLTLTPPPGYQGVFALLVRAVSEEGSGSATNTAAVAVRVGPLASTLSAVPSGERLEGGFGSDLLIGGAGTDTFVLGSVSGGVDIVRNFISSGDQIELPGSAFQELVNAGITITPGVEPVGLDPQLVFDQRSGLLWYFEDTRGLRLIGQLEGVGSISSSDFFFAP